MKHRHLLALVTLSTVAFAPSCGNAEAAPVPQLPTVEFVRPTERELVDWDEFTGRLEAVERVDVRARVSGYLESIHFEDGALVEAGDLLFVIDPRPFEAELAARRAALAQAEAARDLARGNVDRGRKLLEARALAAEDAASREAALAVADAEVLSAQARVEAAELDLDFTRVTAPITGRVSRHEVSVGNLITGGSAGATLLTTIVATGDIHVRIEADSSSVMRYLRQDAAGSLADARGGSAPVEIGLEDEDGFPHQGVIDFVDNAFDSGTATLAIRARIPNPDGVLVPGMFARVRITGRGVREALVVPEKAVQSDQTMRYLLVLDDTDVVQFRPVEVGSLTVDGQREITSGLAPDDRVIAAGLFLARPGAAVAPREAAPRS